MCQTSSKAVGERGPPVSSKTYNRGSSAAPMLGEGEALPPTTSTGRGGKELYEGKPAESSVKEDSSVEL